MSSIEVTRSHDRATIEVVVGEKTARISVSHDRARRLAAQLLGITENENLFKAFAALGERARAEPPREDWVSRLSELLGRTGR